MPGSAGQIRRETVPEKVASDRFDRICKRGKRLPAERGISKATTKPISRRSVTPTLHGTPAESPRQSPAPGGQFRNAYRRHAGRKRLRRRGPAKSQAALRPPKTYARQAGCRPGFSCGPPVRIRETISRPVPCLLPVLSLSLIRFGKPGRTKATAGQGGGNPHAQSGRSDARARETDPKKETTPHAEPQRRSRSVVRTRMETADRENNDNRPAGTIRNRSETP